MRVHPLVHPPRARARKIIRTTNPHRPATAPSANPARTRRSWLGSGLGHDLDALLQSLRDATGLRGRGPRALPELLVRMVGYDRFADRGPPALGLAAGAGMIDQGLRQLLREVLRE